MNQPSTEDTGLVVRLELDVVLGEVLIPEMTDKLGRHWEQPDRRCVIFRNDVAHLTRPVWDALSSYDSSDPSGVYEGKMWRSRGRGKDGPWQLLCWYGVSPHPDKCTLKRRDVVVCDGLRREDGRVCKLATPSYKTPPWSRCDGWFDRTAITDALVTCLACIAGTSTERLQCSICGQAIGMCDHTRSTP